MQQGDAHERLYLRRETYFNHARETIMVLSWLMPAGGMAIEDVAAATPKLIFTEPVDIMAGIQQSRWIAWLQTWIQR